MNLRRTALVGAVAAVALAAPRADAAMTGVISDPVGDARASQTNYDIKSVLIGLTGTKAAPKDFQVIFEVAGTPAVNPGTSYQFVARTGCGTMYVYAYWSALDAGPSSSMQVGKCGGADPTETDGEKGILFEHSLKVEGSKLVFSFPAKALPKEMGIGTTFENPYAYTAPTEPVVGYSTADFGIGEPGSIDYAKGTNFKIA